MKFATREYVKDLLAKVIKRIAPFKFGIDEDGKYGYYKDGEFVKFGTGTDGVAIGTLKEVKNSVVPDKTWIKCDGRELNIVDYPILAEFYKNALGSTNCYGGDGVNTFYVSNNSKNLQGNNIITDTYTSYEDENIVINVPESLVNTTTGTKATISEVFNNTETNTKCLWNSTSGPNGVSESNPFYFTITLKKNVILKKMTLYAWNTSGCRIKDFIVSVSNDNIDYTEIQRLTYNENNTSETFDINYSVYYKYIKITFISTYVTESQRTSIGILGLRLGGYIPNTYIKAIPSFEIDEYCGLGSSNSVAVGTIKKFYSSDNADDSWLPCDGRTLTISSYPELANFYKNALGSINYYGGDGTTTFKVNHPIPNNIVGSTVVNDNSTNYEDENINLSVLSPIGASSYYDKLSKLFIPSESNSIGLLGAGSGPDGVSESNPFSVLIELKNNVILTNIIIYGWTKDYTKCKDFIVLGSNDNETFDEIGRFTYSNGSTSCSFDISYNNYYKYIKFNFISTYVPRTPYGSIGIYGLRLFGYNGALVDTYIKATPTFDIGASVKINGVTKNLESVEVYSSNPISTIKRKEFPVSAGSSSNNACQSFVELDGNLYVLCSYGSNAYFYKVNDENANDITEIIFEAKESPASGSNSCIYKNNGTIYCIGCGYFGSYNIENNTWTKISSSGYTQIYASTSYMPTVLKCNNILYIAVGPKFGKINDDYTITLLSNSPENYGYPITNGTSIWWAYDGIYSYDETSNTWTKKLSGIIRYSSIMINNYILILGKWSSNSTMLVYDITTNTLTESFKLNTYYESTSFFYKNKIYYSNTGLFCVDPVPLNMYLLTNLSDLFK